MKRIQARFLMAAIVLLTVTAAWAYRPGPDIIRECPRCKTPLAQQSMMSGNTFGARFWTDGKMLAPMLPDHPWLVKCPNCGELFWIDEARELGKRAWWYEHNNWQLAPGPEPPSEADFLKVLSSAGLTDAKERYARQRAWWAANDPIRTTENPAAAFSPAQEKNLNALADILDEKDPGQRITKAEIYRELGKFEACVKLLAQPFSEDHHHRVAAFIRKLAEQGIRSVREINVE
ncbi:MAG: hypothetical protein AB1427_19405 [Thermodesulfobacteriota bacterium]